MRDGLEPKGFPETTRVQETVSFVIKLFHNMRNIKIKIIRDGFIENLDLSIFGWVGVSGKGQHPYLIKHAFKIHLRPF